MNWKLAGCSALPIVAIIGCGSPLQNPAGGGPDGGGHRRSAPIEIAGKLVDAFSRPVEGATVVIGGQPPTVTNAMGGETRQTRRGSAHETTNAHMDLCSVRPCLPFGLG